MAVAGNTSNIDVFRDCLSSSILEKSASSHQKPQRRRARKCTGYSAQSDILGQLVQSEAEDMTEFLDVRPFHPHLVISF